MPSRARPNAKRRRPHPATLRRYAEARAKADAPKAEYKAGEMTVKEAVQVMLAVLYTMGILVILILTGTIK